MEQKKNNVNASLKKKVEMSGKGERPDTKKPRELRESESPKPRTERHIFTLETKFSVIAPPDVDQKTLGDEVDKLVDDYLHRKYNVSHIEIPGRPGMPAAGLITELKHKEK